MNATSQTHEPTQTQRAKPDDPAGASIPASAGTGRPVEGRAAEIGREHGEDTLEHETSRAWRALQKRPSLGVLLAGGLAVAAADAIGVGEVALGIAAGYVAYQAIRKRRPAAARPDGDTPAHG